MIWFNLVLWHINHCRLFNAWSIFVYMNNSFKKFILTQVHNSNVKTVQSQTLQFGINTQFSSIKPIDKNLSGTTTPGQSGPGCDSNEGVLHIPHSCSFNGASPSDCLVSYLGHSLGSYPNAEKQSVYSTAQAWMGPHDTRLGGRTLLQRCSRCILQPKPPPTPADWEI